MSYFAHTAGSFESQGSSFAPGTQSEISKCKMKTVACQGCHVRLALPDGGTANFLRCSFCLESTNVQEVQHFEKFNPPKLTPVGSVAKCSAQAPVLVSIPSLCYLCGCIAQIIHVCIVSIHQCSDVRSCRQEMPQVRRSAEESFYLPVWPL